jgi:uncharacterized protein (DUF362 family)
MNLIYLSKTRNRKKFVFKVLKEIQEELKRAKKILLKPNIVSYESYPTTTHPEVLEACLEFLLALKKEVLVADGPAYDAGASDKVIESHPLKGICDKFNIPLINLNAQKMRKVKTQSFELELSEIPFEYDFLISLPVLKSHGPCGITGALKNQYGFLSLRDKPRLHGMNIHKAIAELNAVIKPNFWIVDAVKTLIITNEIRHGGKVRDLGFMLAGKDPVSLDIEGFKLLQKVEPILRDKKPESILHLKYAIDFDIGEKEYDLQILNID